MSFCPSTSNSDVTPFCYSVPPGLPPFLENEIPGDSRSFQEKFPKFSWRNERVSNGMSSP